jgi:hypothetical protein
MANEEMRQEMFNESIATMIKIQQFEMFKKLRGGHASDIGKLFKKYGVFDYIDDAYEFLHIQGAHATYEDISNYMAEQADAQ